MGRKKKEVTANAEKKTMPKNALPKVGKDISEKVHERVLAIFRDNGTGDMSLEEAKWGYAFIVLSVLIEPLRILKNECDRPCNAKCLPFGFHYYGHELETVTQWAEWRLAQCAERLVGGAANG